VPPGEPVPPERSECAGDLLGGGADGVGERVGAGGGGDDEQGLEDGEREAVEPVEGAGDRGGRRGAGGEGGQVGGDGREQLGTRGQQRVKLVVASPAQPVRIRFHAAPQL